jgi:hypothetical protein
MTIPGGSARSRSFRRANERTHPEPWTAAPSTQDATSNDVSKDDDDHGEAEEEEGEDEDEDGDEDEGDAVLVRDRQSRTTLALLQTFHAQTRFWLSRLVSLLPPESTYKDDDPTPNEGDDDDDGREVERSAAAMVVQLAPRDVLELELSPLSSLDARFVEWLAEEYGASHAGTGVRVFVKRGWRDLLGLVFAVSSVSSSSSSTSS